ncbi:MAG: matrixin family metalloprotease, partial [Planctomycetes bacterium]|nr:matrixin family metalloprotease [Planctomycetota bacterium]
MKRTFSSALAAAALVSPSAFGYAFFHTSGGATVKWSNPARTWYVNVTGGPTGSLAAIQAGMNDWTKLFQSRVAWLYGGTTSMVSCATNDGTSNVCFESLGTGVLGQCSFWYSPTTGLMVDSDVRFSTNMSYWPTYDLEGVATHEFGHALGLAHTTDATATMYPYASPNSTSARTPHADDIAGMVALYPPPSTRGLAMGDLDGDGASDLVFASAAGRVSFTTDRHHWTTMPGTYHRVACGDLDGDGD